MSTNSQNKEKDVMKALGEINDKLSKIMGLMAIQGKDIDVQIGILKSQGFSWEEIGTFVGMKADAVRMRSNRKNK